jgi:ribonuclease-3
MDSAPSLSAQAVVLELEARLGYRFKDASLALQAMTHSSSKEKERPSNERLEFFGDAVLGLVVSEYLYRTFPAYEEGELSTMKSIIVSAKTLSACAETLGLDHVILLGRGLSDKRNIPRSILGNAFEAVVAALYLDDGFARAKDFIMKNLTPQIASIVADKHEKNYKSLLQDYAQRHVAAIPVYRVLKETGPDHKKRFQIVVDLDSKTHGPAWGDNKKEAEQLAARIALQALGLLPAEESPGTAESDET